ncbi:MAG: 50S ribosomal protein L4 [Planctomycetes bacterium]|nr:50S ribosomal protein L4 [Planctomycetota bacterium]
MAEVKTIDAGSGSTGTATLDEARLLRKTRREGRGFHPVVLRDAVVMYEANARVGTVQTKERHFVSGSTKKMYKQKHTGNARQGDGKAPHFRGGGVCFGPHPRSWRFALPRKALRKALAVSLSRKIADGEVTVVRSLSFGKPSTKAYAKMLASADAGHASLLVTVGAADENVLKSARNIPGARVVPAAELNARDVAACTRLLLCEGAWDAIVGRIGDAS